FLTLLDRFDGDCVEGMAGAEKAAGQCAGKSPAVGCAALRSCRLAVSRRRTPACCASLDRWGSRCSPPAYNWIAGFACSPPACKCGRGEKAEPQSKSGANAPAFQALVRVSAR